MRTRVLFLILLSLAFVACEKEEKKDNEEHAVKEVLFSYEQTEFANVVLPYRKAEIIYESGKKPALLLYLHGGSSKGADNEAQMKEPAIDSISNYLVLQKMNAIFLVPQCPSDKSWGGMMNGVLKSLIDRYVSEQLVDERKVYILGGSMGGSGTWSMISSYPDLFAAAMPVAGNPSKCNAENVAKTPFFTVMGTNDAIMNMEIVAEFVNKVKSFGGDCMFETETGWTHETSCKESYSKRRLDWVFSR